MRQLLRLALILSSLCSPEITRASESTELERPLDQLATASLTLAQHIDRYIDARLASDEMKPAGQASDGEFLRRVYLDITGVIPPADKVVAFLDSKNPGKRAQLVDDLLASSNYGRHLADVWSDLLLPPRESTDKGLEKEPFRAWMTKSFNANKPWDKLVAEMLTATGTQEENGATTLFLANRSPDKMTDTACRVLLGVQLQCAQCHNHPFTTWKREDYWGLAAFFGKVDDDIGKKLKKGMVANVHEKNAVQAKRLPDSALEARPKFLGGAAPKLNKREPYRPVLAKWLTSADNRYFARAAVNRLWAEFFGRGLVNPVDNLHDGNAPSHPELFDALVNEFVESGFDIKNLIRGFCSSQAYQRSSTLSNDPESDDELYASMAIKPLTPAQLYDSLKLVLDSSDDFSRAERKANKKQGTTNPRDAFIHFFRANEGADPSEYSAGIPQVLRLMNSNWTSRVEPFVRTTIQANQPSARNIERLFLATLSRRPTTEETQRFAKRIQTSKNGPAVYGDLAWALLNSSEFTLNH
jgi:hypothetical protein